MEVALDVDGVYMRDTERLDVVIEFSRQEWDEVLAGLRISGSYDIHRAYAHCSSESVHVGFRGNPAELVVALPEWRAFLEGVRAGEFDL